MTVEKHGIGHLPSTYVKGSGMVSCTCRQLGRVMTAGEAWNRSPDNFLRFLCCGIRGCFRGQQPGSEMATGGLASRGKVYNQAQSEESILNSGIGINRGISTTLDSINLKLSVTKTKSTCPTPPTTTTLVKRQPGRKRSRMPFRTTVRTERKSSKVSTSRATVLSLSLTADWILRYSEHSGRLRGGIYRQAQPRQVQIHRRQPRCDQRLQTQLPQCDIG
jgi:hypothetical protein